MAHPSKEDLERAERLISAAYWLRQEGDFPGALELLDAALTLDPQRADSKSIRALRRALNEDLTPPGGTPMLPELPPPPPLEAASPPASSATAEATNDEETAPELDIEVEIQATPSKRVRQTEPPAPPLEAFLPEAFPAEWVEPSAAAPAHSSAKSKPAAAAERRSWFKRGRKETSEPAAAAATLQSIGDIRPLPQASPTAWVSAGGVVRDDLTANAPSSSVLKGKARVMQSGGLKSSPSLAPAEFELEWNLPAEPTQTAIPSHEPWSMTATTTPALADERVPLPSPQMKAAPSAISVTAPSVPLAAGSSFGAPAQPSFPPVTRSQEFPAVAPLSLFRLTFLEGPMRGRTVPLSVATAFRLSEAQPSAVFEVLAGELVVRDDGVSQGVYVTIRGEERIGSNTRILAGRHEFLYEKRDGVGEGAEPTFHLHELDEKGRPQRSVSLKDEIFSVGRNRATLSLPADDRLAPLHFEITPGPWATFLADHSGDAGTFIRIPTGEPWPLEAGMKVRSGAHLLRVDVAKACDKS